MTTVRGTPISGFPVLLYTTKNTMINVNLGKRYVRRKKMRYPCGHTGNRFSNARTSDEHCPKCRKVILKERRKRIVEFSKVYGWD